MVETMDVEEPQSYSKNIYKRVKKNQPKTRPSSAGSRRRRTKRNKNKYKIINTIPALNNNRTKSYSIVQDQVPWCTVILFDVIDHEMFYISMQQQHTRLP